MNVTRDVRRESRYPTRTDPNRTGPYASTCGDFSPHRLVSGAVAERHDVVSAPRIDVDTSTIEHLDFTPACEHSRHADMHQGDEPSAYVVRVTCSGGCTTGSLMNLCHPGWLMAGRLGIWCRRCDVHGSRDDFWRIVEVLR